MSALRQDLACPGKGRSLPRNAADRDRPRPWREEEKWPCLIECSNAPQLKFCWIRHGRVRVCVCVETASICLSCSVGCLSLIECIFFYIGEWCNFRLHGMFCETNILASVLTILGFAKSDIILWYFWAWTFNVSFYFIFCWAGKKVWVRAIYLLRFSQTQ
jgi:hypothetical protein